MPSVETSTLYLRLLPLLALAATSFYCLFLLASSLPPLEDATLNLQVSSLSDVKGMLSAHLFYPLCLIYDWVFVYLFHGIGALYGNYGTVMVLILATLGASISFLMSKLFGGPLVQHYFLTKNTLKSCAKDKTKENMMIRISKRVAQERATGGLFYYLLFLRIFPFTPNWLLNIVSPHIAIPLRLFSLSVFLGLAPYNIITTQAGVILTSLERLQDVLQPSMILKLGLAACMALVPAILRRRQPLLQHQNLTKKFN